jgi:hypothetical protein
MMFAAVITVGITAPGDAAFSIGIRPVFLRVDAAALAESRARALHLHFAWTAIPLNDESATSTKSPCALL